MQNVNMNAQLSDSLWTNAISQGLTNFNHSMNN